MMSVMSQERDVFTEGVELIKSYFSEYRNTVFAAHLVSRGFNVISLSSKQRLAFERLIRLFRVYATCDNPSDVNKHVDLASLLHVLPGNTHEKLLGHFGR